MSKTWSTALVISMMLVLALLVIPASGKQVGTVISQGATVFIGEEKLDMTPIIDTHSEWSNTTTTSGWTNTSTPTTGTTSSMNITTITVTIINSVIHAPVVETTNTTYTVPLGLATNALNIRNLTNTNTTVLVSNGETKFGWFSSGADIHTTTPKVIDLSYPRYTQMSITPSEFSGYTGNWYHYYTNGTVGTMAFYVSDPQIGISIWDPSGSGQSINGRSIVQNTPVTFRINTNLYSINDGKRANKTPGVALDPVTDGFINLKVKSGSGSTYNQLVTTLNESKSITDIFVDTQPFTWGYTWSTGSVNPYSNQYNYPPGTYYVSAESALNNMKENYRNGGVDFTGKTVSESYSVTLISDTVKLDINKNTVIRGKAFSVILTGKPSSIYHIWIKGIGSMNGTGTESGTLPPQIVNSQEGVDVGAGGFFYFENSGGVNLSQSVPQVDGLNPNPYFANVTTNNLGGRTIEFSTSSATKAQRYTIRVETDHPYGANAQTDEVDVNVEKGAVTIVAAGDQSYFLGEEIKLSGSNSESYTTYLYLVGPNLPSAGAKLSDPNPRNAPVSTAGYTMAPVSGDNSWSYKWGTATVALDAGTYTIYAVNLPKDAESLSDATYGTTSIVLKKPFVSAAVSSSTVAQGDSIRIIGTAEGDPQKGVAIWVLGKNYNNRHTQSINSDSSFVYEVKGSDTENLATGQYFIVVQHPMQNTVFDIDVVGDNVINRELGTGGMTIFKLNGAGSLQGSDAANALIEAIGSPNIDDTYTKFQFIVETPYIYVTPIGDKHIGDKFTIKSETNLAVDDQVLVEVYSSSFKPTQKSQSGEFSGSTGTVKVTKGEGNNGLNALKFDVDTATFRADEYLVKETAIVQDATGTSLFNILDAGVVPKATATPVATPIIVTVAPTPAPRTQEPTPMETVNATPKTTTQASPGFASLYALVGLAAVGFIIVRRD